MPKTDTHTSTSNINLISNPTTVPFLETVLGIYDHNAIHYIEITDGPIHSPLLIAPDFRFTN